MISRAEIFESKETCQYCVQNLSLSNQSRFRALNAENKINYSTTLLTDIQKLNSFGGKSKLDIKYSISCSNFILLAVPSFIDELNNKQYLRNLELTSRYSGQQA
ncbi:Hypothetical_protein [Hexamita inflata]|uniref:Hypothetical_protein n=1 Tax=Hexamita inflata TaxID=28002 RepID=A0AA86PJT8_9EUKA|nr:Hypothetical protein HINF_LOCUS27356 [Hexamita inflata]